MYCNNESSIGGEETKMKGLKHCGINTEILMRYHNIFHWSEQVVVKEGINDKWEIHPINAISELNIQDNKIPSIPTHRLGTT